jgi:hypothetical protein
VGKLMTRGRGLAIWLSATLVLAGCGGGDGTRRNATATATDSPAAVGTPTPTGPVVGTIVWATALDPATNAPTNPVTRFAPTDPVLYATLAVARLPTGATLTASWTYNGVPLDALAAITTAVWSPDTAYLEFHLARGDQTPWPEGTYAVAIALDGQPLATAAVAVG